MNTHDTPCIAFRGTQRLAAGPLSQVALDIKRVLDRDPHAAILLFEASTSQLMDIDTHGSVADVAGRYPPAAAAPSPNPADAVDTPRAPGRPKLGVVAREVTLLPRHWEWLANQAGGASVALRKLVEEARRTHADRDKARLSRESAYRFMSAIASAEPSFEEATRALFAGDLARYDALIAAWPADVRSHAAALARDSFDKT